MRLTSPFAGKATDFPCELLALPAAGDLQRIADTLGSFLTP